MVRVMAAALAGVGIALAGGAAAVGQNHEAVDVAVAIADNAFTPDPISIDAGATVTWTNGDARAHDVAGDGFVSPRLESGASWSYTFTAAGTFAYLCSLHPEMVGTVVVTEHVVAEPTSTSILAGQLPPAATPGPTAVVAAPVPTAAASAAAATSPASTVPAAEERLVLRVEPALVAAAIIAAVAVGTTLHLGAGRRRIT